MGRIYSSTAKQLPREVRDRFDEYLEKKIWRPTLAAAASPVVKAFSADKEMIIEGIANLAEPDRWGEIILPGAWNLELFLKNPIILYEHYRENAVGKCLDVQVRRDGLYYRAQIGDPALYPLTELQERVRSLLAQGILRTNSVGFIPHVIEYDEDEDILRYTDVELLEISIVAIPMQQDSVITSVKGWRQPVSGIKTNKGDNEPTATEMKAMLEENTALTKGCHEMLTKMHSDAGKALTAATERADKAEADLASAKAANDVLTKSHADLETKTAKLLEQLRTQGVLKPAA